MIGTKRKKIDGKAHCDLCKREVPAIHEYQCRISNTTSHWFDLCDGCGAKDREVRGGFLVGVHIQVRRVRQSANRPVKAPSDRLQRV